MTLLNERAVPKTKTAVEKEGLCLFCYQKKPADFTITVTLLCKIYTEVQGQVEHSIYSIKMLSII